MIRYIDKKDSILTILAALLIVLSFPRIELSGLIFISLVPLFFALEGKTPRQAFWIGFGVSYLVTCGAFYWLIYTFHTFGNIGYILSTLIFLIYAVFCNIHIALFTYVVKRFPISHPVFHVFWLASLYTVIEFLFPQIFHWYLGACLYKKTWLIQMADVTGVHGITFLVVGVNYCIYELIRWIKKDTEIFPASSLIFALSILFVFIIYGGLRMRDLKDLMKTGASLKAALIQTNVGNIEKFESSKGYQWAIEKSRSINERLVLKAASQFKDLDLIVLPETAVPGYFTQDRHLNRELMFTLSSRAGIPIFFGGYNKREGNNQTQIYNSVFLISNYFQVLGSYDKIKLLIFGEYLPFSNIFPFLKNLVPAIGDFSSGETMPAIHLTKDLKAAPQICFEAIFPNFVRQFVKQGGNFIVTVTNDSWFGKTASPYQHLMLHTWRTIENRTPMLRAANTGISAFIDLTGRIQSKTKIFKEAILVDRVSIINERSFYTTYGNVFMYFLILLLLGFYTQNAYRKH